MANLDIYSPDNIIANANLNSASWWQQTLSNAQRQAQMENDAYFNSFKRDRTYQLYPDQLEAERSGLNRERLTNENRNVELTNGLSDENVRARNARQDYNIQAPAFKLWASDQAAGFPTAADGIAYVANHASESGYSAPGLKGIYGNQYQQQNTLNNLDGLISSGDERGVSENLQRLGIGRAQRDPATGGWVIVDGQGRRSVPMSAEQLRNYASGRAGLNDKTNDTPYSVRGTALADQDRRYNQRDDQQQANLMMRDLHDVRTALNDKDNQADTARMAQLRQREQYLTSRLYSGQGSNPQPAQSTNWNNRIIGGSGVQVPPAPQRNSYAPPAAPIDAYTKREPVQQQSNAQTYFPADLLYGA